MDRSTKRILAVLVGLFVLGAVLTQVDFTPPTTMERFQEAVEEGEDCQTLFDIRNEFHPADEASAVKIANQRLRRVGCTSASSQRTDQ